MPKSPSLSVLFFDTKMFCNLMSRCKMLLTQRRTAVGWPHHTVASDSLSTVGKAECAVTNTARLPGRSMEQLCCNTGTVLRCR